MIFVSVGTERFPFDRLVRAVDQAACRLNGEPVLIQVGHGTYLPRACQWVRFLPYQELLQRIREARVVVSHAGAGSLLLSLRNGKTPIVVPRRKRFGEHVDDHQAELATRFARLGLAVLADDPEELPALLESSLYRFDARRLLPEAQSPLASRLAEELTSDATRSGVSGSLQEEITKLRAVVDSWLDQQEFVKVLEAGCGSSMRISLGPKAYVVGFDISTKQLERNTAVHEKRLGDLERDWLPESEFDVIVCWDVLEHLRQPRRALRNLIGALKGEGLLVLAFPNVFSLKGLLTKWTPHWFHVWVYRRLFGDQLAGTEDRAPFRTVLRWSIAPAALQRFAREHGLSVEYLSLYENPRQKRLRERYGIVDGWWGFMKQMVRFLSWGTIDAERSDCILVFRKPATAQATRGSEPVSVPGEPAITRGIAP